MRVKRLNSNKEVLIRVNKYLINWGNSGDSGLERQFRDLIYPYWKGQIILFQCPVIGTLLRIDFVNCNKRLAIEIDGPQHESYNKYMHGNRAGYLSSIKRDIFKERFCEQNNIKLLRLKQYDLDNFSPKYILETFGVNII